jgi:hypothetical protein
MLLLVEEIVSRDMYSCHDLFNATLSHIKHFFGREIELDTTPQIECSGAECGGT